MATLAYQDELFLLSIDVALDFAKILKYLGKLIPAFLHQGSQWLLEGPGFPGPLGSLVTPRESPTGGSSFRLLEWLQWVCL